MAGNYHGVRFFPEGAEVNAFNQNDPVTIVGVTEDQDPDAKFLIAVASGEQPNPTTTIIGVTKNGS